MPVDYKQYHPKWSLIRRLIARRANNKCEHCGATNGDYRGQGLKITLIQCGVAHLDQDRNNNRFSNLAYLCRACHLAHDRPYNQVKIQITKRFGKNYLAGQLKLFKKP